MAAGRPRSQRCAAIYLSGTPFDCSHTKAAPHVSLSCERRTNKANGGREMDAITLLKTDHEKVAGIFEQLEPTTERAVKTREELFTKLKYELDIHAHIEETIFYPVLKQEAE